MFLIMSAAYVGQELESEFGRIPPSFLPLGNRRLFQHQVKLAPEGADVFLSIPESFSISSIDMKWLSENNVTVLPTPDCLNLGSSLIAALNLSGQILNHPLHVLYGDTLFRNLPLGNNIASVSKVKDSYNWAVLTDDISHWLQDIKTQQAVEASTIIDGYFLFSDPRKLISCITQSEWDFIKGLNRYHQVIGLNTVESDGWLDFGHVNTYYRSKAEFTTQRAFNELKITSKWVEKSSSKGGKIAAEANWFSTLPFPLRGNIPQFLGSQEVNGRISYKLEYVHLTALNELFVFSILPSHIWHQIFNSCIEFLLLCEEHKDDIKNRTITNNIESLFEVKTIERLNDYCSTTGISLDEKWVFNGGEEVSIAQILNDSKEFLPISSEVDTVMHGDFCFSNILYDFRAGKIKAIDPRGMTAEGKQTIFGDVRYDIAKLSHSILGLYDWIVAGYFIVNIENNEINLEIGREFEHKETQQIFTSLIEKNFSLTVKNLYAMQIHLFLSMLPLHADDIKRQQALFANSFRLHKELTRKDR
ncbi:capsular biosynthesis protein [Shewanella scandinavica]|uniref:capsular biosynthesis protein n=1 Tax=Shewanella scandinavica TaxID=3063538 RepID=UPI003199BBC0